MQTRLGFHGMRLCAGLVFLAIAMPAWSEISIGAGGATPGIAGSPPVTPAPGADNGGAPGIAAAPPAATNPAPAPGGGIAASPPAATNPAPGGGGIAAAPPAASNPAPAPGAGGPPPLQVTPPPLNPPPAQAAIKPHFVAINGQATGPHDEAALRALVARGELKRDTLVWAEGMADWTAAGTVEALAPLFANIPPEVRFDPKAFLVGSWQGDPVPTQIDGFTSAQVQGTATYTADGKLRIHGKLTGTSIYGQYVALTISGDGTFTAQMQGSQQIVITPLVVLSYTAPGGGVGGSDQMTAPFVITILDDNTVADEQGNRSYRMR